MRANILRVNTYIAIKYLKRTLICRTLRCCGQLLPYRARQAAHYQAENGMVSGNRHRIVSPGGANRRIGLFCEHRSLRDGEHREPGEVHLVVSSRNSNCTISIDGAARS